MKNNKILNLPKLARKIEKLKKNNKTVVHCHGVFDVLHIGHIKHFSSAKKLGDILVVTVTPDQYVNKGPNRPVFSLELRMQFLAAIKDIDFIAANTSPNATSAIQGLKPSIYCKGKDYKKNNLDVTGGIKKEIKFIKKVGGKIAYTDDELFSSSKIINQSAYNLSEDQQKFLNKIKINKSVNNNEKIIKTIKSFEKLNILIIGETIIDEYVFCEALGKSGKEPVLVLKDRNTEKYLGGAAAIANNLSSFCKKITLISGIGEKKEHEKFINQNLKKNIKKIFLLKEKSGTIVKKRFIDFINKTKVLGVYSIDDQPLIKKQQIKFDHLIKNAIKKHDMVIVSDYGHGLITEKTARLIVKKSKFIAVNAQLNAANIGYHTLSKYKGANLVIINENELRHEFRNKLENLNNLIQKLSEKLKSKYITVTSGDDGAKIHIRSTKEIIKCPAFANTVTDKIGTGDTMLALLAISIFNKIDVRFSMLLSALAAAENIKYMANSKSLEKSGIIKTIQSYLK